MEVTSVIFVCSMLTQGEKITACVPWSKHGVDVGEQVGILRSSLRSLPTTVWGGTFCEENVGWCSFQERSESFLVLLVVW